MLTFGDHLKTYIDFVSFHRCITNSQKRWVVYYYNWVAILSLHMYRYASYYINWSRSSIYIYILTILFVYCTALRLPRCSAFTYIPTFSPLLIYTDFLTHLLNNLLHFRSIFICFPRYFTLFSTFPPFQLPISLEWIRRQINPLKATPLRLMT